MLLDLAQSDKVKKSNMISSIIPAFLGISEPGMLLYMGGGLFKYILVILVALGTAFTITKFAYNEEEAK